MEEENDNTVKGERAEAVKESKEDETMKKEEQNAKGKRERTRSPMERDETYRRMVRESRAMARRLDGLPWAKLVATEHFFDTLETSKAAVAFHKHH
jgi:FtsZ-interacting cell division protein YlmF